MLSSSHVLDRQSRQASLYSEKKQTFACSLSNLLLLGADRIDLTLASITEGRGGRAVHLGLSLERKRLSPAPFMLVTEEMVLLSLLYRTPSGIGPSLGLVGPVSIYCNLER